MTNPLMQTIIPDVSWDGHPIGYHSCIGSRHYQAGYLCCLTLCRFLNLYHPYFNNTLINLKSWYKSTKNSPNIR